MVARWTGENQLTLDAVLDDMILRCRELDLRVLGSEQQLLVNFTILLTAKTMHALFGPSRRKWIALMRRLRVLVLMHPDCVPPESTDGYSAQEIN